mmetsp:Transcript_15742/g.23168  ORF Transcript_15742/g.23168 Transcript_15742/m.23168 type:complete len:870 (-) Transcript_15742:62-2671(-)|eukprot:CAMPEP_0194203464 /NCGR_PEP_ID=MMETSP0156-20130528/3227_1 /TAXON_ID=33649 /ORGANISM="Thalassionema nitzschioides, Strain L26-B" /LENGTH=869 /DNA_ID=CAMNT_0038929217 /DNA_START=49 /DNA_END=2658 /DNA_ORIENTATION=+
MAGQSLCDDDSFSCYVPETIDPGYALLIGTAIFCLLTNAILPCLVSMGRRYEKRNISRNDQENTDTAKEPISPTEKTPTDQPIVDATAQKTEDAAARTENGINAYHPDSYVRAPAKKAHNPGLKNLLDQIIMPPYPDEGSVIGGSAMVGSHSNLNGQPARYAASEMAGSETGRSTLSFVSRKSAATAFGNTHFLDVGHGRHRNNAARRQRRVLMDKQLRMKNQETELEADRKEYAALLINDDGGASELKGNYEARAVQSEVASRVSHHGNRKNRRTRRGVEGSAISGTSTTLTHRLRGRKRAEGSAISGLSRRGHSPEPSVLPPLDANDISPNDAADANDPGNYILPKADIEGDQDVDLCCGQQAWWHPSMIAAAFDRVVSIAEWDHEMKRIIRLCVPYSIAALVEGVGDAVYVGLVANFLGTESLSALTLVETLFELSGQFLGGVLATEATLCSHAVGAGNHKLAGNYVQVSTVIFSLLWIPNSILWMYFIFDVVLLFGFPESTAKIAEDFAIVCLFNDWILGLTEAYNGLLEVIGFEKFVATMTIFQQLVQLSATLVLLIFRKEATLTEVALIKACNDVLFLVLSIAISVCATRGRLNKYINGMCGSLAILDRKILGTVICTAIPLSFGYLFEYGEWEILTIFAAFLGPAEVAAWGVLGSLWGAFETLSEAIADGGEVRVAYHLGAANPGMAQISSYKLILIGVFTSLMSTSILFIMGENVAVWFTPDAALQHMVADLIPMIGLGNIVLSAGTVSWGLVGAQGRYRLATLVALLGSWLVTMPVAATFTYGLNLNLQGITAAVVIGYSVSCTTLFYILLRSDWERISHHIVEINNESDDEDESSSESSDSDDEAIEVKLDTASARSDN